VTSTIVFENDGVREYVGGYDDWVAQRSKPSTTETERKQEPAKAKTAPQSSEQKPKKQRLAFHEKRELELLPKKIETLEASLAELHQVVAQPEFYKQPSTEIARQQGKV